MPGAPPRPVRSPGWYYRFSEYLRERFGCRVRKITVDPGMGCPGRDSSGAGGCVYCLPEGFYRGRRDLPLKGQIETGLSDAGKGKNPAEKFIVYFQRRTNTYAPLEKLKRVYDSVLGFPEVAGIAIGTRPDCVNGEILSLIGSYCGRYEVWVEYGMQSSNDETLKRINRGHSFGDFLRAVEMTRKHPGIKICAHLIIGLPGEGMDDFIDSARETALLALEGVKLHPLHIMKGTALASSYLKGGLNLLDLEGYAGAVSEVLERLHPDTVIQRLTADCPEKFLIAPAWMRDKNRVLKTIERVMESRGSYQGKRYERE